MFLDLIKFEWVFWKRKRSFYGMLAFYLLLGFAGATMARFPFPGTYSNSPYVLNYLLGMISLICIFSTTILAAQSLFREQDARFDPILFATPLRKMPYVVSRFLIIFCITLLCYFLLVCGLMTGHLLTAKGNDQLGPFHLSYYLHPFLVLLLPNIMLCTAIACSIGLATRSKMLVYVSGILLYFLYWSVSIFTNSPLIANSTPVSATAMNWSARLDPFGLAAFMEQTRYWTATERNTQLLQLSGNVLINRMLYLAVAVVLLLFAYKRFSMSGARHKSSRRKERSSAKPIANYYHPVVTRTAGIRYNLKSLWSLVRIEVKSIVKTVPLWIICVGWAGFFGIELFSDLSGNTRIPPKLATTGLMVTQVLYALPVVGLPVILFYGSEVFWRSKMMRFAQLEDTTAVKPGVSLVSKWLPLVFIVVVLIALSVALCIGCQFLLGYPIIDWSLYASLFYLIGLPLALCAALVTCLQAFVKNKYVGIAIAGIALAITNTSMGSIAGIRHPLLKFANAFDGTYSDMNGFGSATEAFGVKMLYWSFVAAVIFMLASKARQGIKPLRQVKWLTMILVCCSGAVATGYCIYHQTNIVNAKSNNDWQQAYEEKYSYLKNRPQPTVTAIRTSIDLYPQDESFTVKGAYNLLNKTGVPVDTLYIFADKAMQWARIEVANAALQSKDTVNGYYTFVLKNSLQPNDSIESNFSFHYKRSPFNKGASFNAILHNGSFSRISRYFPTPGYNAGNEINDPAERKRRGMPPMHSSADATIEDGQHFIELDMVVSTAEGQTAIGIGELVKQWQQGDRHYFHYVTPEPVPFRFAVASAQYTVKKLLHSGVNIELYYNPGHYENADRFIDVAKQTLDYGTQQIAPYPFKTLRLVEISAFSKGFAGTAYPASLFINEGFGFRSKIDGNPGRDIINEMTSHELSHTWWGNSKIAPADGPGSKLMTETLAMYTELMIYKKTYGEAYLLDRVNVHKDIYLAERGNAAEEPLYRSAPEKSYLCYDKGMVAMYQLYLLLGEDKINSALKNFYAKYVYPNRPPVAIDLLNELYAVADKKQYTKIDELFRQVIIYDLVIDKAIVTKDTTGRYFVNLQAAAYKYEEDGKGNKKQVLFTEPLEAAVYFENGEKQTLLLNVHSNKINTVVILPRKPVKIVLDPAGKFLTVSTEHKEKALGL
jgi:ABC-2 type transport system permease protein